MSNLPAINQIRKQLFFFQMKVTKKLIYATIAMSFSFGALFQLPWNFGPTDIIDGVCYPIGVWSSVAGRRLSGLYIFIVEYLLPVTTMTFCYGRIYHVLHRRVSDFADR
jgi:hypothetical protein